MILVDLIRIKICLWHHFYELPDVVIACIEHGVSGNIQSNWAALVKHDNNMKDYSLVVDWSP